MRPSVSVVIRARNEEDWIGHCLEAVFGQDYPQPEVVIVDNGSTDRTLAIASTFCAPRIVPLSDYSPGRALNRGVAATCGDVVVFLSAHCIPRDSQWLEHLVGSFDADIAGVYGRQLPLAFGEATDFRDLLLTFGSEPREQTNDNFFHNANSAITRATWEEVPFDEEVPNIEDRLWAKQVLGRGMKIRYEPRAAVFHHHGIHHNQSRERAESTLEVLKQVEAFDRATYMPETLLPGGRDIVAIIPILEALDVVGGQHPVVGLLMELASCSYIKDTYVVSSDEQIVAEVDQAGAKCLARPAELATNAASLDDVLRWAVAELDGEERFPDYIVYANPEYVLRPPGLIHALIEDACFQGLDTVVVAYPEYQDYWRYRESSRNYEKLGEGLIPRTEKHPMYKTLPGLGTVTRTRIVRAGHLVGEHRVGVVETTDLRHTLRMSDDVQRDLIELTLGAGYDATTTGGGGRDDS